MSQLELNKPALSQVKYSNYVILDKELYIAFAKEEDVYYIAAKSIVAWKQPQRKPAKP